jgi:hypothetical protein
VITRLVNFIAVDIAHYVTKRGNGAHYLRLLLKATPNFTPLTPSS